MKNVKLTIEFDGTNYHGWQSQKNAITVQDVITEAITKVTGENCQLTGASRTDAGVHALGFVANFRTSSSIPAEKFSFVLNTCLPPDIVVKNSEEVDMSFHARFSAVSKRYRYIFLNSKHPSALYRNRVFHVPWRLDVDAMREAALFFKGTHDFSAFRASGASTETSVRTMYDVSLTQKDEMIVFEVEGNGFLYNMVRIMAGTLVDVGLGKIAAERIAVILKNGERNMAGRTAPPQGLYLVCVNY